MVDDELNVGIAFEVVYFQDIDAQRLLIETLALVVGGTLSKRRTASLSAR
jgi:LysR family cyn operon transcriptional activator